MLWLLPAAPGPWPFFRLTTAVTVSPAGGPRIGAGRRVAGATGPVFTLPEGSLAATTESIERRSAAEAAAGVAASAPLTKAGAGGREGRTGGGLAAAQVSKAG